MYLTLNCCLLSICRGIISVSDRVFYVILEVSHVKIIKDDYHFNFLLTFCKNVVIMYIASCASKIGEQRMLVSENALNLSEWGNQGRKTLNTGQFKGGHVIRGLLPMELKHFVLSLPSTATTLSHNNTFQVNLFQLLIP